jgi:hypothetical protein
MEALDPIDVMRVKTSYFTRLPAQKQQQYPVPVVLFSNGAEGVDATASRNAFEIELRDRLQAEFPEAMEIEICCADGQEPQGTLTEVSMTRPSDQRMLIAREWVDAVAKLVWAHGRWIAPPKA